MKLNDLLQFAVKNDASDVHIQAKSPPIVRIAGQIRPIDVPALTNEQIKTFILEMADDIPADSLEKDVVEGLDFSFAIENLARFRCSAFSNLGNLGIVIRVIHEKIPDFANLNLPPVIRQIALARRGLTLVTGTTGSGKSTTLAAMIDLINQTYRSKIMTIEDPIEYVHTNKKALISQLEVGIDTPSYNRALRQALRQDPDVILIGELRDVESLRMALHASDTGHQVFSTVHSANAPQTIERIIAMFPPAEHKILLSQLAGSIEAIISQRLITTVDEKRLPALEILRGGPVTEKFILEDKLSELHDFIEEGESGMQSFDQHILRIYNDERISGTEAMRWATNPEAIAMQIRGIG